MKSDVSTKASSTITLDNGDFTIDLQDFDIDKFRFPDSKGGGIRGPLGSFVMYQRKSDEYLEISPNLEPLYFDDAIDLLKDSCKRINLKSLTGVRYHANTWGFSSTNWFATNILPQMPDLECLDCQKTLVTPNRSDVPMGINSMLMAVHTKLRFVDMSHNFLSEDGARAFTSFLEISKTIKTLRINNCGMEAKSCEMIAESITKNPELKLTEIQAKNNKFGKDGFLILKSCFE